MNVDPTDDQAPSVTAPGCPPAPSSLPDEDFVAAGLVVSELAGADFNLANAAVR